MTGNECLRCNSTVRPRQEARQCDNCQRWQHRVCEYHFILQCEKYIDVRRYLKKYYWQMPSCFELIQLLSTQY